MKLISCYIENFGGLSQYRVKFEDGLTVIQEHNGFGKTTLAEFLRAMFYGFPRASSKGLGKRKKYTPWNGGKFGGTLDFEYEGVCYRIERSFGATPARDRFVLYDLETGRESNRFTQQIGLELFQLDADSFERSTYMPQIHDTSSLTTNTIQAKLGDLVEDTNDINNFDKAVEALKSKRSSFVPFRGNGGTVADANREITRLQNALDAAAGKPGELAEVQNQIAQMEQQLVAQKTELEDVRKQITLTAQGAARREIRKQYQDKLREYNETLTVATELEQRFPAGVPTEQDMETLEQAVEQLAILAGQELTTQADLNAQRIVEENQNLFSDGLPTDETLDEVQQQFETYQALQMRQKSVGLSPADREQLDVLTAFFESGVPGQEQIGELADHQRQLLQLESVLESQTMEQEELRRLDILRRQLGENIPSKETIQAHRQRLRRMDALREENRKLAEHPVPMQQVPEQKKTNAGLTIGMLILGALGVALGVVLLVMEIYAVGGISLGVGLLAVLGGGVLGIRHMIDSRISATAPVAYGLSPETQSKIQSNEQEIRDLEDQIRVFAAAYSANSVLAEALAEIENMAETYKSLAERKRAMDGKRNALSAEIDQHRQALSAGLRPYYDVADTYDSQISDLRLKCSQYQKLLQEKVDAERQMQELKEQSMQLGRQLTAFFTPYYGANTPEQAGVLLTRLRSARDEFLHARQQLAQWKERTETNAAQTQQWRSIREKFAEAYRLEAHSREEVRKLWETIGDFQKSRQRCEVLKQQKDAFAAEHQDVLGAEELGAEADADELGGLERTLTAAIEQIMDTLLRQKQKQEQLRDEIQEIPQMQDQLQLWKEKRQEDQASADILDDTVSFLQKAKDKLAGSYLGGIQTSFAQLMNRLMDESQEQILMTPELEVRLERLGEARELGYFSAGQTDMIMLCMRFALVDALFGDVKPFVILDDPFVNLDDEGTKKALKLLRELSQDRQIIYMVCNSSRV